MTYRKQYRDAAREALRDVPTFFSFTAMSAWAQNIDPETLPAFGVATPRENKKLEAFRTSAREVQLVVVLKILGADAIEDTLDVYAELVERAVIPAIRTDEIYCDLTQTTVTVDGSGENRVGTLTMEFGVEATLADPLAD